MTESELTWTPDRYQQEVIDAEQGYHLVLAPPGCGKTQILTERIRQAHAQGVAYEDMLCLTFTNRAARSMRERIEAHIADGGASEVYVGNVHRFCSKFLFDNSLIPAESSVIDEEDAVSILARCLDEDERAVAANFFRRRQYAEVIHFAGFMHQLSHHHPRAIRVHPECVSSDDVEAMRKLCGLLRMPFTPEAMNDMFLHTDTYEDAARSDVLDIGSQQLIGTLLRKMRLAYQYAAYKHENKLLDFEDLLMLTYDALAADDGDKLRRYSWIQVDEVQDLNALQLAIIDGLTDRNFRTVMYLGDEQQAIFSFMGAKMSTLDMLRQRCEGRLHRLSLNHRSPRYLLDVFNVYAKELLGIDNALLPTATNGSASTGSELQVMSSERIETEYGDIADVVARLYASSQEETTAVIVSANADANLMSEALEQRHLPHFKVSGDDLFASPGIKLLLAHLNILGNEHNFIGWSRLLRGLHVFESNAAARGFVRGLLDRSMLPTDLLLYPGSSYVQEFVRCYEQEDLVVFDTETTGLSVFDDDIVQIAAVRMRQGQVVPGSAFVVFMDTDREIPSRLGDMENPLLAEMHRHTLHSHQEGLRMFMEYVGNSMLLGHNADYDYHILDFNLQRYLPSISLKDRSPRYLDSLKLIRLLEPNLREYKLKYLLSALQLEGENSHLADADVAATCNVVRHCYGKAKLMVPSQLEWVSHPRFEKRAAVLRRNYLSVYEHAKDLLYKRDPCADSPALVSEMQRFYDHLCREKLLEPNGKLHYVTRFLANDMLTPHETTSLAEQLAAHITEINTLKEADLCNSHTLEERIFVTTVHKAKGLEFDNVIIFDAVDGRYPNYYNQNNERLLAEDKRKFYVALTRAKRRLYVAWSRTRIDYHNQCHPRNITPFMKPLLRFFEIGK